MDRHDAATAVYAGLLLVVLGGVAWAAGEPFVFPSLGPSAFLMAKARRGSSVTPRRVIGGHTVGVIGGLVTYGLVDPGVALSTSLPAFSEGALELAVAAALSVLLTSVGMLATNTSHPPACATTLIVALGVLPTVRAGAVIVLAVTVLVAVHELVLRSVAL
ncbi:HPP family protein [Halostella sp. PRR32]|uniref:HPP family protein n=1 Tax=Halostella sp. PRR32 TaxID=3098147 RepID=UPI002B1D9F99|nr:HPP family protein [Halostella sp. PRR32]